VGGGGWGVGGGGWGVGGGGEGRQSGMDESSFSAESHILIRRLFSPPPALSLPASLLGAGALALGEEGRLDLDGLLLLLCDLRLQWGNGGRGERRGEEREIREHCSSGQPQLRLGSPTPPHLLVLDLGLLLGLLVAALHLHLVVLAVVVVIVVVAVVLAAPARRLDGRLLIARRLARGRLARRGVRRLRVVRALRAALVAVREVEADAVVERHRLALRKGGEGVGGVGWGVWGGGVGGWEDRKQQRNDPNGTRKAHTDTPRFRAATHRAPIAVSLRPTPPRAAPLRRTFLQSESEQSETVSLRPWDELEP
jgi:hypothetical protein